MNLAGAGHAAIGVDGPRLHPHRRRRCRGYFRVAKCDVKALARNVVVVFEENHIAAVGDTAEASAKIDTYAPHGDRKIRQVRTAVQKSGNEGVGRRAVLALVLDVGSDRRKVAPRGGAEDKKRHLAQRRF